MNVKEVKKTERVTFVTTEETKKKLKKLAKANGRSMSNYIERLIELEIKNAG